VKKFKFLRFKKSKTSKSSKKPKNRLQRKLRFNFIRNFSIGTKYLGVLSLSIFLFLIATVVVYYQLTIAKNNVDDIIDKSQLANDIAQLALYVEQQNSLISDYIIIGNTTYIDEFKKVSERLHEVIERVEPQITNEENKYLFSRVVDNNEKITDLFLNTIVNEDIDESEVVFAQIQIGSQKSSSVSLLNRLIEDVNKEQSKSVTTVNKSMNDTVTFLITVNIVSIIIGLIIMLIVSRMISKQLKKSFPLRQKFQLVI